MLASPESFDRIDYADRFVVVLPEPMDAAAFCSLILESAPRWLDVLLTVRDKIVGRLGFSTQQRNYGAPVRLSPGGKFGPLVVRSVSADAVVCADADRHLSFRATFATSRDRTRGSITTEVQFNDAVGRAYFALIKPLHCLLIPRLMSAPFPSRAVRARA